MKKKPAPRAKRIPREVQLAALREDSELQMRDLIRRRLDLPLEKRLNFLRRRLPGGGSCL
jgi:hypothetical protein